MFGRKKKRWEPARGTVIDSRVAKVKVYNDAGTSVTREFIVEVHPPAGGVFRATVGPPRSSDFLDPRVGADVRVEFDAESRDVRFDMSDESISLKAFERAQRASFDATLNEG